MTVTVQTEITSVEVDLDTYAVTVTLPGPQGATGPTGPAGASDHGALTGLSDDDHSQYALLAGRAGGQELKGGTAASDDLTLTSTNHATKGNIFVSDEEFMLRDSADPTKTAQFELSSIATGTNREYTLPNANGILVITNIAQTLTNKTLDATSNTVTNVGASEVEKGIISDQTAETVPANGDEILINDVSAGGGAGALRKMTYSDFTAGLGGGAVSSVFGRTGAVVAAEGDYDLAELGDVSAAAQTANFVMAAGDGSAGGDYRGRLLVAADIPALAASKITSGTLVHERGGLEADVSAGDGYVQIKSGATTVIKTNHAAAGAPGTGNDNTQGYAVGSRWIDTTNDKEYVCLDTSTGAAVWTETTGGGGGNSFTTINCSSGSDPIADSSTDTLNLTAGNGMVVTGDSSTDTVTFSTKFANGTYTGNGGTTQAITGVGFQPKFIYISHRSDGELSPFWKTGQSGTKSMYLIAGNQQYEDDMIISNDSDGFTVGDGTGTSIGANVLNVTSRVYEYVAWG